MWNRDELVKLAAAEEAAFLDERMSRLYFAMCRNKGYLLEPLVPETQARQELEQALDALTEADIRRHMNAPEPPDSIYERMLELKEARLAQLAAKQTGTPMAVPSPDDSEPEQAS